jgi:hypothetical protein
MSDFNVGDHLVSSRGMYTHHGLYVGGSKVVHYNGFKDKRHSGPIEETSLSIFEDGSRSSIRIYTDRAYSRNESAARARVRIGEDLYCVFANNCEHFVAWCINGDHHSPQVVRVSHSASTAIAGLGGAAGVVAIAETGGGVA